MDPAFNQLTSLSFHVNRASNSWVTTFPKFDLENQGSRSWVRSKLNVTTWVQHSINSHPFRFMWIRHPIPELQHFQNLTLKIKGQGHGWGHSSKSQCGSNILSTHIPFILCQTSIPFLSCDFFKNLILKIKGQGHGWGHSSKSQCGSNTISIHILFVPCQSALPFLRYSIFKIWPWKSRVKVKWPWCCTTTGLDNSIELWMVQIHPGVSEICVPQSLDPICAKFDKFLAHGQAHMGQMGKWPWQCTTTGLDNSTELRMEKIH